MAFGDKETYENYIAPAPISSDYPSKFNFYLVNSIDMLKSILSGMGKDIAIDTETTGLDLDEAFMVGYSFCYDGINAYYVPVNHAPYVVENVVEITKEEYDSKRDSILNSNDLTKDLELAKYIYSDVEDKYYYREEITKDDSLGKESVDVIYNAIKGKIVYMFNARYDMRVFERYGLIEDNIPIEERDINHIRYDMSHNHCSIFDLQAFIFDLDTNVPYPSLKKSEEYFLGWRGSSYADTVGDEENNNFYNLRPEEGYQYAGTDALGTYLLAKHPKIMGIAVESNKANRYPMLRSSVRLDNAFLYPLMIMEDEYTTIDIEKLNSYSSYYGGEIDKLKSKLYGMVGEEFNIGSPKQKSEMLKRLGITTYEYDGSRALNLRGELKADKEHINITIDKLKLSKDDPKRIFMEGLIEYAALTKQKGTYVDAFIDMATKSKYYGKLRFGYKTMVVPSGRLAAGGQKKNKYFSETNIQNVPKPHPTTVYYVRYDDLIKVKPEFEGKYDNDYQEYTFEGGYSYKILDWVFKESIWNIGIPEKKIEGFEQDLNMRSTFCADKDKYWVSCDFSAQELRLAALLSGEEGWTKTFANDGDLHEYMAKQIWNPEEYDKAKRKQAKKVNFGILYGMTARNFANDFSISIEEAQDIVDKYKKGAVSLFNWVEREEKLAKNPGTVYTMFGRPRRLGWYLSDERSYGMQQFGLRSTANTIIQGSGGDILKMSFLNIYEKFFSTPELLIKNRKYIKFINTVHDEINYNVSRDKIQELVPEILRCMRMWFPDWQFPMKVGLAISCRWGTNIDFIYDDKAFIPIPEGVIPEERFSQYPFEWQLANRTFGPHSFYKDQNGIYMRNPNFLHIVEPDGEELTDKDYVPKEVFRENIEVVEPILDPNAPKMFDNLL